MKKKLIIDNIDEAYYNIIRNKVLDVLLSLNKGYTVNYLTYDIESQVVDGEIIRLLGNLSKEEIIDKLKNIIDMLEGK